ncbi:MAG TPA: ABC transporter substrate binding protein [Sedimentisphaerales bacterium]|nr:ABC transporter substrate binding protein [Sedimentisphaerales bacterium]
MEKRNIIVGVFSYFNMRRVFVLLFCFVILPQCVSAKIKRDPIRGVLVLDSYHKGYYWSDGILDSIDAEFKKSGVDADLVVEYMDMKYNDPEDVYPVLFQLYRLKFADVKFDAIISVDNDSLDFLLQYRDELFKDVPIVFCGINAFEDSMIAGQKQITGVTENLDIPQNLDMIMKLYPEVKDVVVICEKTNDVAYDEIVSAFPRYQDRLNFKVLRDLTFEELGKRLRLIGDESVVLFAGFSTDAANKYIPIEKSYQIITDNTNRPIFCLWRSMVDYGFLGGIACDSSLQGEFAAKKTLEILSGKSADEIAIAREGFNKPIFDYKVVKHFKIPLSKLPAGSFLLNEPKSFYYLYRPYIWLVLVVFVILSISIFLLLFNVFRRVSAEKALRESQRCLRAILDSSSDVAWLKDEHGRFIAVNETYAHLCGYGVDELVGKKDDDFWPADLAAKYVADDRKMIETGEGLRVEEVVQLKNGTVLWIESIKNPIFNEKGKAIGTSGIGRDMTAHKEVEDALAAERNLLRTLIDNLPNYIYIKDRQSRFTLCNEANYHMLGFKSEDDITGKTDFSFFSEELAKQWFAEEQEIMRTGKALIARQESLVRWGERTWSSITKVPLKDDNGNITGLVGITTDITHLKNIEHDLQIAREELEKRVLERTSQLAEVNESLLNEIEIRKKAEEMLLSSQSRLRSLASELSLAEERLRHKIATDVHDNIGQNLAMSKIRLEELRKNLGVGELSEKVRELLELISQTISVTRSLTFDISPPVLYELGFEPAMEWLVRNARKSHGFDAEFESDGKDKPIDNNIRVLLFQAVRELLVNVAKHAKASMVTVISTREDNHIKVRVIDDGIGFDFERVRRKADDFIGFGLFSIRERLGFVGGSIEIDSKKGEGTKVILRAPLII